MHYKVERNPCVCIIGNILKGNRVEEHPPHKDNWIRIFGFLCEIHEPCNPETKNTSKEEYAGFEIADCIPSAISGKRGIIEPADGYNGPGFITKKKPKKAGTHTYGFKIMGKPAACYFDDNVGRERLKRLSQIRLQKISKI